ncbi:MAG: oligopeptidase A, partial [Burkholderiaceae bacterium]|nr:oligopeptidase A [Burkholderiaceae bacterium]
MPNPLLQTGGLPLFDQIKPEHVNQALDELLISSSKALELVTASDFPSDWHAISKVLDVCIEKLSTSWGAVSHLNHVADTPELRAAYNDALPKVTEFLTRLGSDERLYAKYK